MALRMDLPLFRIFDGVREKFQDGKDVEQLVPASWDLKSGDVLDYQNGNIYGQAVVIGLGKIDGQMVQCKFKKAS